MAALHLFLGLLLSNLLAVDGLVLSVPVDTLPLSQTTATPSPASPNIPLIVWHGLGDSFEGDGIKATAQLYRQIYPGSEVFTVALADSADGDRQASFLGNLTTQIESVCEELLGHERLPYMEGANYLGFSQGGQFARGLIERCNVPPARNLMTFGSQHSGIYQFADCDGGDWWCKAWSGALRSNTWADWVQGKVVPAQYFRDPEDLDSYLEHSNFLADVNNERKVKNKKYSKNLGGLKQFVMYMFEEDEVVKPKESAFFAEVNKTTGDITPVHDTALYKEDWIGLRMLGEEDRLIFKTIPGKHMNVGQDDLEEAFKKYFAPESDAFPAEDVGYLNRGDDL